MTKLDKRFLGLFRGHPIYKRATPAEIDCAIELLERSYVKGSPCIFISREYVKRWLDCGYEIEDLRGKCLVMAPIVMQVEREMGYLVLDEVAA